MQQLLGALPEQLSMSRPMKGPLLMTADDEAETAERLHDHLDSYSNTLQVSPTRATPCARANEGGAAQGSQRTGEKRSSLARRLKKEVFSSDDRSRRQFSADNVLHLR